MTKMVIKMISWLLALAATSCTSQLPETRSKADSDTVIISKTDLQDKIKGGWAGQVIGCTYGGPTEFRWNGTMIDNRVPIPWDDSRMLWYYENEPGLYDDVYMDLTFVDVFEKHGLEAADSLHALAFARAEYPLWHANQAARYNILNGIMPPASGHWKNNPHADDIDFQIEADFAGLMSPGMANSAAEIANRIGHIMNFGDGVYGGVYVAAMYALAYVYNDIEQVVSEALMTVPKESEFYQCIADVIQWHSRYPEDWRSTWFETQKKWASDRGCPDGVFVPFNIDAKINAAYIVIGLLYGKGDFGATTDIATRCGQDSDCNPANAAGILGTMIGYSKIPDHWKQGLNKVEKLNFRYTEMSLNKVYETGFRHASEMIKRNGGREEGESFAIRCQLPQPVAYEAAFEGLFPKERRRLNNLLSPANSEISFEMQGCGFVISGSARKEQQLPDITLEADVYADGQFLETVRLPTQTGIRRHDVAWKYDLPEGNHVILLKVRHVPEGYHIYVGDGVLYSAKDPGNRAYSSIAGI
ncbi:MAG: ADP-ribosylglycohydrolase family protein [Prolixibacteraceae bacterium]